MTNLTTKARSCQLREAAKEIRQRAYAASMNGRSDANQDIPYAEKYEALADFIDGVEAAHQSRVTELLQANNRMEDEARAARAQVLRLRGLLREALPTLEHDTPPFKGVDELVESIREVVGDPE